jgi:hypothetical protein
MSEEYKNLRELNVKPGDVVECWGDDIGRIDDEMVWRGQKGGKQVVSESVEPAWRIISRAPRDDTAGDKPVSPATPDSPKLWRDMTDAEKGALLLAKYEGKVIECLSTKDAAGWIHTPYPAWQTDLFYRVRPDPKIETVKLHGRKYTTQVYPSGVWDFDRNDYRLGDTHVITFNLIDGKPDTSSIKMEEL